MIAAFASDNTAGVHPAVLERLSLVNSGNELSYGADDYTLAAQAAFQKLFSVPVESYFVYNGTAANVLALAPFLQVQGSILCCESAHIYNDECGAPEGFLGAKLQKISSTDGKISLEALTASLHISDSEHNVQPQVLSLTQCTELGTVYTVAELKALCDFAHAQGLWVHVDGARIANAVVALSVSLSELLVETGVDVVSFGGTKNGLMFGEAVVFLNTQFTKNMRFLRKKSMQLNSKMRYLSAQFSVLLEQDLWLSNARTANLRAQQLAEGLKIFSEFELHVPVQTNGVFCWVPNELIVKLKQKFIFYVLRTGSAKSLCRFMCSFNMQESEVSALLDTIKHSR